MQYASHLSRSVRMPPKARRVLVAAQCIQMSADRRAAQHDPEHDRQPHEQRRRYPNRFAKYRKCRIEDLNPAAAAVGPITAAVMLRSSPAKLRQSDQRRQRGDERRQSDHGDQPGVQTADEQPNDDRPRNRRDNHPCMKSDLRALHSFRIEDQDDRGANRPAHAIMEPAERSIPPAMITIALPSAKMPSITACRRISTALTPGKCQ